MNEIESAALSEASPTNPVLNPRIRGGQCIAARLVGIDQPTVREVVELDDLNSGGARVITNRCWNLRDRVIVSDYSGNFSQVGEIAICQSTEDERWILGIVFDQPLRAAVSSLPVES